MSKHYKIIFSYFSFNSIPFRCVFICIWSHIIWSWIFIMPRVTIVSLSRVEKHMQEKTFWNFLNTYKMAFKRKAGILLTLAPQRRNVDMVYAMKDGWFTNVSSYNYEYMPKIYAFLWRYLRDTRQKIHIFRFYSCILFFFFQRIFFCPFCFLFLPSTASSFPYTYIQSWQTNSIMSGLFVCSTS